MDIVHEDLKRAVLEAGIKHADVALRVIARIDGDPDFRDAVAAAVMTKDPKSIETLAYGHFEPLVPKRNPHGHKLEPELPKLVPPVNAGQLVQLLNDRTVLVASKLLSNGAIDAAVTSWVKNRISAVIDLVIGVQDDGFSRVRFDSHNRTTTVMTAIRARVEKAAAPAVERALAAVDFSDLTERIAVKARQEIRDAYDRAARDYIKDRAKSWAEEKARLDVDKLLAQAKAELEDR
jgi:hypothetical protein